MKKLNINQNIIKPKYGKNSAELRFYRDALAADLKSCRQKIKDAGGSDASELQEAVLKRHRTQSYT